MKRLSVMLWEIEDKDLETLPEGWPILVYDTLYETIETRRNVKRDLPSGKNKRYVRLMYKLPPAVGKAAGGSLEGEAPGRATTTAWPPFFCASVSSLSSGAGRPLPMRKDSLTCLKPVSLLNLCPLATSNKRTCPLLPVEDRGDGSPTRQT